MPLSPVTSPRHPREMGFMPINNENGQEGDIPLTKMRSGSSTGARRPGMNDAMSPTNGEEKHGLFHRRGAAGRRKVQRQPTLGRQRTGDSEIALNFMGKLYTKVIGASVVTRYLVYVVPVALLLAVPIIVLYVTGNQEKIHLGEFNEGLNANNSTAQPGEEVASIRTIKGQPLYELFIWFMISWLSLWGGKIVAHFLPPIFMFFCGVVSSGTRKYATVLRALEIPLSLFFWALGSWVAFRFKFFDDRISWVDTVKKILGALFVSSAVYLGEKTIVQLISITYHQRSFANRIKDSKRDVYLLGLLYDASRTLFPMYCPEFEEEDFIINDSIDVMLRRGAGKGHKKSGSVTPMRLVANVGRFGDKVTSVFGNIASEITGKNVFNPNSAHSVVVEALEKVRTSEAMARRIWMSFVVEGSDSLSQEDIEEVLGPAHKEHAEECFASIDADSNGDISLEEMIRKVVEIGKERKAIAHSMKDISQALSVFDRILQFIVLLIVIFVFLAFFQSSFITTLATAGTALLSLSFVFAVTTQEFLGSCIFLFVKHPYDVGDRVDITGPEKEQLIVEKISLLYTVFTRIDKMQVVQVPNIVLNNLWIENVTRSKAMKEVIDVSISYDTSFEDIELLRAEMEKFVRHPDNARDFQPDFSFGVYGVGDLDKLQLKVAMKHKSNWHNETVRATRRSKFICALALALKRVPIYGPGGGGEALGGPTNPSYSVAVSDQEAAAARAKADEAKEGKRMVPTNPVRVGSTANKNASKAAEMRAAAELNTRDPAAEAADGWGMTIDDQTLNSRDQSLDRRRDNDIETVRQELLAKTTSQRGRRQAGQTLPAQPVGEDNPSVQLTRFRSNGSNFDVESQTGRQAGFGQSPYGNMTTTIAGGAAAAHTQGFLAPQQPYASGAGSFAGVPGAATSPAAGSSSGLRQPQQGQSFFPGPPQQGQNPFSGQPPAGPR